MRCQLPVLVDLVDRRNRYIEEGILITVLTFTSAILEQGQGVGQRIVAITQSTVEVVGIGKERGEGIDILIILIRIEQ